jgi:hypothetical protein
LNITEDEPIWSQVVAVASGLPANMMQFGVP